MKVFIFFTISTFIFFLGFSQPPPLETVGNPTVSTPVDLYTGWTNNQSVVNYSGTAQIENVNQSNNQFSSGGGNVFFTNTIGTSFRIDKLPMAPNPGAIGINFNMFGYDTSHPESLNELGLYVSLDSGITWNQLSYRRFWQLVPSIYPPQPWDNFTSLLTTNIDLPKVAIKFIQNTSTKTFRIDDIRINYGYLLSINLSHFSVTDQSEKAHLRWKSTSTNSQEIFIIEKSKDGVNFSSIGQLNAKGNGIFEYEFADQNSVKSFYRLKMIDVNNKITYSKILLFTSSKIINKIVHSIYPNPVKDKLYLDINNCSNGYTNLSIVDLNGKVVLKKSILLNTCPIKYILNIQSLSTGIYYLKISNSNMNQSEKIIVTN